MTPLDHFYDRMRTQLQEHGSVELGMSVTLYDLIQITGPLGLSPSSVKLYRRGIHGVLTLAVDDG